MVDTQAEWKTVNGVCLNRLSAVCRNLTLSRN